MIVATDRSIEPPGRLCAFVLTDLNEDGPAGPIPPVEAELRGMIDGFTLLLGKSP